MEQEFTQPPGSQFPKWSCCFLLDWIPPQGGLARTRPREETRVGEVGADRALVEASQADEFFSHHCCAWVPLYSEKATPRGQSTGNKQCGVSAVGTQLQHTSRGLLFHQPYQDLTYGKRELLQQTWEMDFRPQKEISNAHLQLPTSWSLISLQLVSAAPVVPLLLQAY